MPVILNITRISQYRSPFKYYKVIWFNLQDYNCLYYMHTTYPIQAREVVRLHSVSC